MATRTPLPSNASGHQAYNWNAWNGRMTGLDLLNTIKKDDEYNKLERGFGSLAEVVKYRKQYAPEIQKLLNDREPAINVLNYKLERHSQELRDLRANTRTATEDVEKKENAARLKEIDNRHNKMYPVFKTTFYDKIVADFGTEGSSKESVYYQPTDAKHIARLQSIAKEASRDDQERSFYALAVCEKLNNEVDRLEAKATQIDDLSKELEDTRKERDRLKEQWEEADGRASNLSQELSGYRNELEKRNAEAQDLASQPPTTPRELELSQSLDEKTALLSERQKELEGLREQLQTSQEELDKLRNMAETDLSRVTDEKAALELEVKQFERSREALDVLARDAESQLIDFLRKCLRHIVFKDVDWSTTKLGPLARVLPYFSKNQRPAKGLSLPLTKPRQSEFASSFDRDVSNRPLDELACLLVTSLDNDRWFDNSEKLMDHLLWLDRDVMPQFFPPTGTLEGSNRFMLSCMVSRLHDIVVAANTNALCSYWASSLLVQLACRWKFEEPYMLVGGLEQDLSNMPLLKAAGYLRLRLAAQMTLSRALKVSDNTIAPHSFEDDDDADQGEDQESSSSSEDERMQTSEYESQTTDEYWPLVGAGRFKDDVEKTSSACTLDTVEYFRTVCPDNIYGNLGDWYVLMDYDQSSLLAFSDGGSTYYFLTNDDDTSFTQNPANITEFDITSRKGHVIWDHRARDGSASRFGVDFEYGDGLYRFLDACAGDQLRRKIDAEIDRNKQRFENDSKEREARLKASRAQAGLNQD